MTENVIGVFGYNNTRLYDVLKIRQIVRERLNAQILLVKEGITPGDLDVTPYCFDHPPEDPAMTPLLSEYLQKKDLRLIGCLPFSDKGVIGAAFVARHFGLFGDDCDSAFAMLDKNRFRMLEAEFEVDSTHYKKPFFEGAISAEQLHEILERRGPFFLKPTSEGNSRGCMKIGISADLKRWLHENPDAFYSGVICEEILGLAGEYSFDGVNETYWITQKFTTSGAYRAEYQHILPAPFSRDERIRIHEVLEPILKQMGTHGGAFHHEFFKLQDGRLASVEPNRRPAGMWLWDLASWVFPDFDPWSVWIDRCAGKEPEWKLLDPEGYAGIRGVIADRDGSLESVNHSALESELERELGKDQFKIMYLKQVGDSVRSEARNNSDFLAYIAHRNPDYDDLSRKLDLSEKIFLRHLEVSLCASE